MHNRLSIPFYQNLKVKMDSKRVTFTSNHAKTYLFY